MYKRKTMYKIWIYTQSDKTYRTAKYLEYITVDTFLVLRSSKI